MASKYLFLFPLLLFPFLLNAQTTTRSTHEDILLKNLDDSTKINYKLFNDFLDKHVLFNPIYSCDTCEASGLGKCAYYYYLQIPQNKKTSRLIGRMNGDLTTAMIKEINDGITNSLENKNFAVGYFEVPHIPDYTEPLTNILGSKKLLSLGLMSKLYCAKALSTERMKFRSEKRIALLKSAIALDPNASYALLALADEYGNAQYKTDSAIIFAKRAANASPKYAYTYSTIAWNYQFKDKYDSVIHYYRKLENFGTPFNISAWQGIGQVYRNTSLFDSSDYYFNKITSSKEYASLGLWELGINSYLENDTVKGNNYFEKVRGMGKKDYTWTHPFNHELYEVADALHDIKRYSEAIGYYERYINTKPNYVGGSYYSIACCYSLQNDKQKAIEYLDKAIENHVVFGYEDITREVDFEKIKNAQEFTTLMKKYFPDK